MSVEGISWNMSATVDKWSAEDARWLRARTGLLTPSAADFEAYKIKPYETLIRPGNLVTTAGLTRVTSLITGGGGQASTNTSARIGTGNGAGSAAVGDTALSAAAGSTNQWWQIMDATFPTVAAGVITYKSTYASADGNYAWNEWGTDIGTPTVTSTAVISATMLNHKTSAALGTKSAGAVWAFTATLTLV